VTRPFDSRRARHQIIRHEPAHFLLYIMEEEEVANIKRALAMLG
jgi:hypothetical protein